jgi:hypothetical protein
MGRGDAFNGASLARWSDFVQGDDVTGGCGFALLFVLRALVWKSSGKRILEDQRLVLPS